MDDNLMAEVVVTPELPLSAHLRNAILRRIWMGDYPVGQLLPSTRDLARQLGVNRNTVSKVYQELSREGVVRSVRGKGVVVAKRAVPGGYFSSKESIAQQLDDLARQAAECGIPRDEFAALCTASIGVHYDDGLRLAFVECSERDTVEISHELALATVLPVEPVHLPELQATPRRFAHFDLIVTTFYHLSEVEAALRTIRAEIPVIAIQMNPVPDLLLQIARLQSGTKTAIVAKNRRTLQVLRHIAETYNPALVVQTLILEEQPEALATLVAWADVVVDSQSVHECVKEVAPEAKTLTVRYQIDPQSLDFLRKRISEKTNPERAGSPLAMPGLPPLATNGARR